MADLKIGIVGCGGIGAVHAKSWAKVEGARITAACDAELDRAKATGATPYSDWEQMLASETLDALDVCTPPNLHAPVVLAAIRRRLPVLCEKPLARNPGEAGEMVLAAEAAGTLLMTAFCHRFHPPVEFVRELIDSGRL